MCLSAPYPLFSRGFTKAVVHCCVNSPSTNDKLTNFTKVGNSRSKASLSMLVGTASKSQYFAAISLMICLASSFNGGSKLDSLGGELSLRSYTGRSSSLSLIVWIFSIKILQTDLLVLLYYHILEVDFPSSYPLMMRLTYTASYYPYCIPIHFLTQIPSWPSSMIV